MNLYRMDLHIHSVLSPCAELDMGARDIVEKCVRENIDIIAVTDHNSTMNSRAVAKAATGRPLEVICGLEVQSSEDIHILSLFPDHAMASDFEGWVNDRLPRIPNRPDRFGEQLIIDENNLVTGEVEFLLLQGIDATADEIIQMTARSGGTSILAHIDRSAYSYVAVLGMIPADLCVDAVELSGRLSREDSLSWRQQAGGRAVIRSSDAHRLDDISIERTTPVLLEQPCLGEIHMALHGLEGRKILWPWDDVTSTQET